MTENHPITPTQELVREWAKGCSPYDIPADHIARCAARWGADQELEACCEWLDYNYPSVNCRTLRAARRPKPPSLKEQALEALNKIEDNKATYLESSIIRRALESLPE